MDFNEYQELASTTAIYPGKGTIIGLCYAGLGLGEAGEVQGKIKKVLRDDDGILTNEKADAIAGELGDGLWYLSAVAEEIGWTLDEIAESNIAKLFDRKDRGVLKGSGDYR